MTIHIQIYIYIIYTNIYIIYIYINNVYIYIFVYVYIYIYIQLSYLRRSFSSPGFDTTCALAIFILARQIRRALAFRRAMALGWLMTSYKAPMAMCRFLCLTTVSYLVGLWFVNVVNFKPLEKPSQSWIVHRFDIDHRSNHISLQRSIETSFAGLCFCQARLRLSTGPRAVRLHLYSKGGGPMTHVPSGNLT